jgi:hypothetical protein
MYSDVDGVEGYGMFSDMTYAQRRGLIHSASLDYIDDKLDISDLGFIRQNDVIVGQYGIIRTKSQGLDRFRQLRNSVYFYVQTNTDGFLTRAGVFTNQSWMFHNSSQLRWTLNFFPARWDDVNSRGNGMFKTDDRWLTQIAFGTDSAKKFSWSGTLGAEQEEVNQTWTYSSDFGFTWTPNDRFSVDLDLHYKKRDGWLVHQTGRNFTTYAADDFQPRFAIDLFLTANQQLRLTTQWAAIKAEAQDYWQVPISEGELVERMPAPGAWNEDFSLSRLTAQARYHWQIGPLSDLFVVYTRGSNLTNLSLEDGFHDLWQNALQEPVVNVFVIKLRYRFGT